MLICVLGRQPELGIAELEAVLGPGPIVRISEECVGIREPHGEVKQETLGGTIKTAKLIAIIPSTKRNRVYAESRSIIAGCLKEAAAASEHKISFGISAYGMRMGQNQLHKLSFDVKRDLGEAGVNVRVVVGKGSELSSAQILHNGLAGGGCEFLMVEGKTRVYLARTVSVQDIESYSKRDYGRPRRDTKTGMLPPKLAQIMLNLAGASRMRNVLDPFCGTGVVLMEAALRNCRIMGGDLRAGMVEDTKTNLRWIGKEYSIKVDASRIECADATTKRWSERFDRVVSELYLGRQFASLPERETLERAMDECNVIATRFLTNLRRQIDPRVRCCIAVPAWSSPHGFIRLPVVYRLGDLGYERVEFVHADSKSLIYHRPDQVVARDLLVLRCKEDQPD